ncbi:DNA cytosine methyltransferase [Candidatus Woesearchaeota archaeon]|nr:DNA cytosine methyltransferase [Candidatus Woesearchaeota archaeon]
MQEKKELRIASLFSGCGGLDFGFSNAGFNVVFANDNDPDIWQTFERNHGIVIDKRSIREIKSAEIPEVVGIIGGPPCQSWSLAGAMRGIKDSRGRLFYEYIRVLRDKKPLFFLAENVPGIISSAHLPEFLKIINEFKKIGYNVSYKLLDARDFGAPQERKRVIIVGYRNDLGKAFSFPQPDGRRISLKEAIGDLPASMPAKEYNSGNGSLPIPNHEHMNGGFSTIYMSRNRRKNWHEQSFTIQAGGRHAPLHPSSAEMIKVGKDKWVFKGGNGARHRRLSVRECARIQTFPDDFIFHYGNVASGYKMIGNAVPVKLAEAIARRIRNDLQELVPKRQMIVELHQ